MKQLSNTDCATVIRILKEVEALPSASDRERNRARVAKALRRKLERKFLQ